ncbi:Procathepsin L [Lemmus lemmus]
MEYAFQYVKDNRGLDARASYAYEAWNGPCRYDPKYSAADVTGYVKIPVSEAALMNAVATVGPVSVGIDSHHYSFRFYSGGMYYEADCNGILVVGYGEESDGKKYWLVKNSWGAGWGMNDYIKMARDRATTGIAKHAVYTTV